VSERHFVRQTYSIWLAALFGLTLLRLILAATRPLAPDEAYYWLWSQHLQAGYYDHPPMVALWIRIGTLLAGSKPLAIRLLGPLSAAAGSLCLWRAAEDLAPNRHAGLIAAGLFNATLIAGTGSIIMTPDTPLLFFWSATIAALGRWIATRDGRWWLLAGAAAGGAMLSKYTAILLVIAIGGWLLTTHNGRRALTKPWPWAGLFLALLIFAPNIFWNATHGWVSYLKQGGRVKQFDPARSLQFLAELIFGQIGLITPLIFGLMVAGVWRLFRPPNAAAKLLLWLTLLPAAVFLEHVISGRVQANWPAIILPAGCIAASCLPEPVLDRWLRPALALGFIMTLAVYAQSAAAVFPIPPDRDPTALQLAGWNDLTNQLSLRQTAFVTADDYATLSELAYHAPAGMVVTAFGPRWRYFDFLAANELPGASGIMVTRRSDAPCSNLLGTAARHAGLLPVMTYRLCGYTANEDGVLLPGPK
jgi:4-amino-4-deoxy-L-arabinose transferase-like glycosyltransferase